jgi:hypothetical protein
MKDLELTEVLLMLRSYMLRLEMEIEAKYPEGKRSSYPQLTRRYVKEMEQLWEDKAYLATFNPSIFKEITERDKGDEG